MPYVPKWSDHECVFLPKPSLQEIDFEGDDGSEVGDDVTVTTEPPDTTSHGNTEDQEAELSEADIKSMKVNNNIISLVGLVHLKKV